MISLFKKACFVAAATRRRNAAAGRVRSVCLGAALAAALLAGACAPAGPPPPVDLDFLPCSGQLITASGNATTSRAFAAMAARADYVLIGEGHTQMCDHEVQLRLVKSLAGTMDPPPAIGLEMAAKDKQDVLDAFNRGEVNATDLEARLEWKDRWGYSFSLFKPVFEFARKNSLPVYGLNVPPDLLDKVEDADLDDLSPEERALFPETVVPGPEAQHAALKKAMDMHPGMDSSNSERLERFLFKQSIWDTVMAEQAHWLRKRLNRPVVVIAGSGHVESGHGIAHRLKLYDPEARVLLAMPWRGGGDLGPEIADVFFYCPPEYASRMGMLLEERFAGVTLVRVEPRGRAHEAGLRAGDVLVEAAGVPVARLFDLHKAGREAHESGENLTVTILRRGGLYTFDLGPLGKGR